MDELEKERDFNKRLLTNFMALAKLVGLPDNSNPDAIYQAVQTLARKSEVSNYGSLPGEVVVNEEKWGLIEVQLVNDKLQGIYKRN